MSRLATVIRLRRQTLDNARRELGALAEKRSGIEGERADLERRLAAETEIARNDVQAACVFGEYLASVRAQRRALDGRLTETDREIALAEAKVRDAFRELKRFELADAARASRAKAAAARAEQAVLDEVALAAFRRKESGQA